MIWLPATLAQLAATFSGAALARRVREHQPVAVALVILTAASLLREGRKALLGGFPPGPYHGWARVGFHTEQALYLLSPAALAWLALVVLGGYSAHERQLAACPPMAKDARLFRRQMTTAAMCVTWLTLSVACAALYPALRGDTLRRVYLAAELAALAVALLAVAAWGRRVVRLLREREGMKQILTKGWDGDAANVVLDVDAELAAEASATRICVLAIVLTSAAMLVAGPWRAGLFGSAWRLEQAGLLALYPALTIAQLVALVKVGKQ